MHFALVGPLATQDYKVHLLSRYFLQAYWWKTRFRHWPSVCLKSFECQNFKQSLQCGVIWNHMAYLPSSAC